MTNLLAASNFDAMFEDADEDLVREVIQAFADDDRREEQHAGLQRREAGVLNREPHFFGPFGSPTLRTTIDDFWRQQVKHGAVGDPDLWEWFARQPEGEYARIRARSRKVVVGFAGNKRETIRFA